MRVLVVAPTQADINTQADWIGTIQGHELTVLNRFVTVREVLGHIAGGAYQVIHFATHGCTTALTMSDGEIPNHLLEDALRAAGRIELVVLGACESIHLGAHLYMAGVPRVLSWRVRVDDRAAIEWSRVFYQALGLSGDIWEAQQSASEAVRRLSFEPPIFLNGRMSKLEAEVTNLRKRNQAGGLPRWAFGVLVAYGVLLAGILAMLAGR